MDQSLRKLTIEDVESNSGNSFDLNDLLHPAQAFSHPSDVAHDPDLTLNEKRAILASWASDACAIESVPELRSAPHGRRPVTFDEVMDALRSLDTDAAESSRRFRRLVRKRRIFGRGSNQGGHGQPAVA